MIMIAMAARQRREVMKKKKGTRNNSNVEENVNNGELIFTRFAEHASLLEIIFSAARLIAVPLTVCTIWMSVVKKS